MQFTQKDRDLILKIAQENRSFRQNFEPRLAEVEKLIKGSEVSSESVKSPIQQGKKKKDTRKNQDDDSSIEVTFKDSEVDTTFQRMLIESLYVTLIELCEKNNIESLLIKIDESNLGSSNK